MESVKIYLSGGMNGLTLEEQLRWRNQFIDAIKYGEYDCVKTPIFFNPPLYYSTNTNFHRSEREAMEFELNQLRKSDLVVVNFNVPKSLGTAMELILAKEHRIPVVGLNKMNHVLHPWLKECCTRICDDMYELVEHVYGYYLS